MRISRRLFFIKDYLRLAHFTTHDLPNAAYCLDSPWRVQSGAMSETLKRILLSCLTLLIAACVCVSLVSLGTAILFLR
jgi:hypothetical protein